MKIKIILAIAVLSVFIFWFERKKSDSDKLRAELSYKDSLEKKMLAEKNKTHTIETLNYIDRNGLRQGYWKISVAMLSKMDNKSSPFSSYPQKPSDAIVEEGRYVDGKEEGEWILYNPDGSVEKKINYKAGVAVK
jgi:antitoxin component YwqK of YwqJK toxin-antitoxin module